jgi:hypothetical protein
MHTPTSWFLAVLAAVQVAQAAPQGISGTARCGPSFGLTCKGSSFGNCCSQYSYCGSTDSYCGSGCQSGWGTCNSDPAPSVTPPITTPNLKVSNNGRCAQKKNGRTCLGSEYGDCCRYVVSKAFRGTFVLTSIQSIRLLWSVAGVLCARL